MKYGGDRVQIVSPEDTLAYYLAEILHRQRSKEASQQMNMVFIAQRERIKPERLAEVLKRMNAHNTLLREPPRKLSGILTDELIEFLQSILKKET